MPGKAEQLLAILSAAPAVPVLTIEDSRVAVPLARALVAGGLPTIEVTLRTRAALDSLKAISGDVKGARVGAAGVRKAGQYEQAVDAGAAYVAGPGATPGLAEAARDSRVPLLPGVATASEAMALAEHGFRLMKFYPAKPAGGVPYLKALATPLPAVGFCPTGGIGPNVARAYLALANVVSVGVSWVAPRSAVAAGDWDAVTALARQAAVMGR